MLLSLKMYLFGPILSITRHFKSVSLYWSRYSKGSLWEKLRYPRISCSHVGWLEEAGIFSWELWAWLLKCWARTPSFKTQIPGSLMPLAFKVKQPCWEADRKRKKERESHLSPSKEKANRHCCWGAVIPKGLGWFLEPAALITKATTLWINGKWDTRWILK